MRVIIARELALRVTAGSTRAPQVSKLEDCLLYTSDRHSLAGPDVPAKPGKL